MRRPIGTPRPATPRRRFLRTVALFVLGIAFLLPGSALAAQVLSGNNVEVAGAIDDDVYAAGRDVLISGAVVGDIHAGGENLALTGSVGGSFNAAGRNVDIGGQVAGSARAAGETVGLTGTVGGDFMAGASEVRIGPEGVVGRDLIVGARTVNLEGRVVRDLVGTADTVTIGGTVAGVRIRADRVILLQGARVEGDLVYTSAARVEIEDGAVVAGRVVQRRPPEPENPVAGVVTSTLGGILLGVLVLWLLPPLLPAASKALRHSPLAVLGVGLAGIMLMPVLLVGTLIAAVLLGFGGAVVLGLSAFYAGLLAVAKVVVGFTLGTVLLRKSEVDPRTDMRAALFGVLLGVAIIGILAALPVLGTVILGLAGLAGFGSGLLAFVRWRRSARQVGYAGAPL